MKKVEDLNRGELIKADLYSRPNAINGKYKTAELGLDDLADVKDNDIFFLETLKMKADLADKKFVEAESQGKDINDPNVLKQLGREINALGKPIHKNESILTAIFVSARLILIYGIAVAIWGLVFQKGLLTFAIYGAIAGFLISLTFVAPVIAFQRTKEKVQDMSFSAGALWGNLGIAIGVLGLISWVIRLIFFS